MSQSAPCSRQSSPSAAVIGSLPLTKKRRCHTTKRTPSVGDAAESDEEQKRASHNILERRRRDDLKVSFQTLRVNVPGLSDNQRAPKVTILRKATEYIAEITMQNEERERRLDQERRKERDLLERVASLKATFNY